LYGCGKSNRQTFIFTDVTGDAFGKIWALSKVVFGDPVGKVRKSLMNAVVP